jgi:type II secretory pathway pseudopilin PulG
MKRARSEDGFALISAILLLVIILGLGFGLLLFVDNQQRASGREQASESGFNVAEAALNAQVGQISRLWPEKEEQAYPDTKNGEITGIVGCTPATTAIGGCPTAANLSAGYPNVSPVPCTGISTKDAWGSPLTNQWTSYVRDDKNSSTYFDSTKERTEPGWDANNDGKLWVRSVGVVQCHVVSIVTVVSRQLVTLNFPKDAVGGNWFKVTNEGNKVLVNTQGEPAGQAGEIAMRCEGVATGECEQWNETKKQVSPDTTKKPGLPSPLLSEEQLAALKSQAIALSTFHSPTVKGCPTKTEELVGLPAYVEGCGNLHLTDGVANTSNAPGFLVVADGTLELKGNAEFFGVIYAHNPSNYAGAVVVIGGTAQVIGAIEVDGRGGIEFGSSKANLIYNSKAIEEVKAYAGATPTRNTFRILPSGQ